MGFITCSEHLPSVVAIVEVVVSSVVTPFGMVVVATVAINTVGAGILTAIQLKVCMCVRKHSKR